MKNTRRNVYQLIGENIQEGNETCPISGKILDDKSIGFLINGKQMKVCSHECMIKIKNIYNLIKN